MQLNQLNPKMKWSVFPQILPKVIPLFAHQGKIWGAIVSSNKIWV